MRPEMNRFLCNLEESVRTPYLTPVYFKAPVLVRYIYNPRFYCEFHSETYGSVSDVAGNFDLSFGINQKGTVIAWLGDLEKLPPSERNLWIEENIPSEADMKSDFFQSQIEAKFTPPPLSIVCLNELAKLDASFSGSKGVHLYKDRSLTGRIEETRRYRRLVLNNVDDFKRFISDFNEIVNENTNNDELRELLNSHKITYESGSKGNKILEKVYTNILGDTANLIAPFFYLYDLRIWADHEGNEQKLNDVANKLGVPCVTDYAAIMTALFTKVICSCQKLAAKIPSNE